MSLRSAKKEQKEKPEKQRKKPKAEKRAAKVIEKPPVAVEEVSKADEVIEPQEKRTQEVEETFTAETEPPVIEPVQEEVPSAVDESFIQEEPEPVQERVEVPVEPERPVFEERVTEVIEEPVVEALQVEVEAEEEAYDYPVFDNTRTMEEFGLSKDEADDFIVDLIHQVEVEMPGLEEAVSRQDNKKIEDVSHMIKGSAINLGTGGIADVLIDFNTYMKTANDPSVIAGHMRNLRRALKVLKEQFQ